jgi:MoxR-like ATPase
MSDANTDTQRFQEVARSLRDEIGRVIVGHDRAVHHVLISLLAGGHSLIEGVPGLGKTMLVKAIAATLDLKYSRIQFTPDLMPADITGTTIIRESGGGRRDFEFEPGPLFANIVLADEINRATPKTQAALLEAMAEQTVTVAGESHALQAPFYVLATQNPIEMAGTYPLPEAQLDRFLFKVLIGYPSGAELEEILGRTTAGEEQAPRQVADGSDVEGMIRLAREVPIAPHVTRYAVALTKATHPDDPEAPTITTRYVRYGASPRGAQALVLAAKVAALLAGRFNVSYEDIREVLPPALRHRLILNFEAEAEAIDADAVLEEIAMGVRPEGA